jgi:hypothetical protein
MSLQSLMTSLSLLLNLAVLVPVCASLLLSAPWTVAAFGPPSPAQGILLSIYLAIGVLSALLLFRPVPAAVAALLAVQILYKVTTPLTTGSISNPVVISNLLIAAVHAVTLVVLLRRSGVRAWETGSQTPW